MTCRDTCKNKGKVSGLSQETFCSMCIRGDSWKNDYYDGADVMEIVKIAKPHWHKLNKLDSIRQFLMVNESRHALDNWGIKYIEIRIDMRTGNFLLKEGNSDSPSFLMIQSSHRQ